MLVTCCFSAQEQPTSILRLGRVVFVLLDDGKGGDGSHGRHVGQWRGKVVMGKCEQRRLGLVWAEDQSGES
jgi:hypothetical protein